MYPYIEPYDTGFLEVGDGHTLYYEQCGNPDGQPAVYLHGGPGAGSHPDLRRFFNPEHYRIILYDQRGCGQSTPFAEVEHNSITHLVDDMDRLRRHLEIDKWLVVGSSWGSALALHNVLEYQDTVTGLILTGISMSSREKVAWLTEEGGASEIMPEWFRPYRDFIPPEKRKNGLAEAYYEIMAHGSEEEVLEAARLFTIWDTAILNFDVPYDRIREVEEEPEKFIPLTRIFFHFVKHYYDDGNREKILEGVKKLGHIPCTIIHGRYDLICPVSNAFDLYEAFPDSELQVLHATGHTSREPSIARTIVDVTDKIAGLSYGDRTYIRDVQ